MLGMGAPSSLDPRRRAVGAVADGMRRAEAANHHQGYWQVNLPVAP
jgi:hypothetical protein